ncbi:hypothetical protein H2200_005899 [Cladophialophora chaetospira]|uniref:Transcription factor domain-containing protein n=1 Tax=Cladophialophora chaetospira TaxID=386627 RepID=A0AA38X9X3_9EURO|nr:hypothetical protein H2200_005899 [Cladophialophora chaetospira]
MLQQSGWPGERSASQHDVELANEPLTPEFLAGFKHALLASPAAQDNENLLTRSLRSVHHGDDFTYPMAILYDFPELPDEPVLISLEQSFFTRFHDHVMINELPLQKQPQQVLPPYLRLAVACLSCAASYDESPLQEPRDIARKLFLAGDRLWAVMLEVDNSEARTLESVISVLRLHAILLSMYGVLSADVAVWHPVEQYLLPSATTIARRLRLHESPLTNGTTTPQLINPKARSSVIACLLLVNVLGALHLNMPCYLTPNELGIHLGPEPVTFSQIYTSLLDPDLALAAGPASQCMPSLLLIAVLTDCICLRRSLADLVSLGSEDSKSHRGAQLAYNPHQVLSPVREYRRMEDRLSSALDKWMERFGHDAAPDNLALAYFCRLYLASPELSILPRLAHYPPVVQRENLSAVDSSVNVSDQSVAHAWAILENVDTRSKDEDTMCAIWSPIIVFYAALVVWARSQQRNDQGTKAGSVKQLLVFKLELERMRWPCCVEMASTLDRLMEQGRSSIRH